jgi:predicted transcriptional regulator
MTVEDVISGMLRAEGGFQKALRSMIVDELDMTMNEFCEVTGISKSTMYKILEEKREPNLRTVRQIVKALRALASADGERFIAVIASDTVLESLPDHVDFDGHMVPIREYPVSTVEDAIIAAVRAERDGALGVVCAPIVAPTIERILSVPVSPVIPSTSLSRAIDGIMDSL